MKFSLTMEDVALIQRQIPIKDELRPFVGLTDVLKFCGTAEGIPITLLQAAKKYDPTISVSKITDMMGNLEMLEVVASLVSKFWGGPDDAKEAGEPPDPLAETNAIGS
jgi:hypothetical protein